MLCGKIQVGLYRRSGRCGNMGQMLRTALCFFEQRSVRDDAFHQTGRQRSPARSYDDRGELTLPLPLPFAAQCATTSEGGRQRAREGVRQRVIVLRVAKIP